MTEEPDKIPVYHECPRCHDTNYVVSIFGSICGHCWYDPSVDGVIEDEEG